VEIGGKLFIMHHWLKGDGRPLHSSTLHPMLLMVFEGFAQCVLDSMSVNGRQCCL